jgi:hypothetical protein
MMIARKNGSGVCRWQRWAGKSPMSSSPRRGEEEVDAELQVVATPNSTFPRKPH